MADLYTEGEPGLWRLVIRPLVEQELGPIVCDARELTIPEGLLAVTEAEVHAVAPCHALASLAPAYPGRLVLHASAHGAWPAATGCRLAVLDARCELTAHLEALAALVASGTKSPTILLHGLNDGSATGGPGDPFSTLGERGFEAVELVGFPSARLVAPAGSPRSHPSLALAARVAAGDRSHAANGHRNGSAALGAPASPLVGEPVEAAEAALRAKLENAEVRLSAAEVARDAAERRLQASQDLIDALRVLNDEARADLRRAQVHVGDLRRAVAGSERLNELVRAESSVIAIEHARLLQDIEAHRTMARAMRADLVRLHASQSWRLGHALTRIARVLTFRRPGRTNALSKAIDRLDAASPPGPDQRA